MNENTPSIPSAQNWRTISQSVKPRAMSRGGRWRLFMAGVRITSVTLVLGGLAWGAWLVAAALQEDPRRIPAAAKAVPMKAPELETTRDGVLDRTWLARTLELKPGVSLMELDLGRLRERLLLERQVLTADLTRMFPDRLKVRITERSPIARIRIDSEGGPRDLVVARDGVAFFGTGFDAGMLDTLPWLDVGLARDGIAYRTLVDLEQVARLLADAQFSAPHIYQTWQKLTLARLVSDDEIEVETKNRVTAIFSAKGEFFVQLAKLDYICDQLASKPYARARIDLSLGREVPVMIEPLVPLRPTRTVAKPVSPRFPSAFSVSQLLSKP